MNNDRRKRIANLANELTGSLTELESLRDEEQEAFDNLPESLQESERGQASGEAVDALDDASSTLGDLVSDLEGLQ